jgi:hypothetical protein
MDRIDLGQFTCVMSGALVSASTKVAGRHYLDHLLLAA